MHPRAHRNEPDHNRTCETPRRSQGVGENLSEIIPHAAACPCRECLEPLARIGRLYMRKESLPHSDPCPTEYEMAGVATPACLVGQCPRCNALDELLDAVHEYEMSEQVLAALAGERG